MDNKHTELMLPVREDVDKLMKEGNDSPIKGWAMSNILLKIHEKHGSEGVKIAREYMVKDYAGMKGV
tara:strand:+ start:157 stop:357 length:201 start_codon:yes stop_codon:yes gene_type:complete